jgi:hypothetical protein
LLPSFLSKVWSLILLLRPLLLLMSHELMPLLPKPLLLLLLLISLLPKLLLLLHSQLISGGSFLPSTVPLFRLF